MTRVYLRLHEWSGPPAPDVGEASFLQSSSGTTGIKRGVLVHDEAVLAQEGAYGAALELCADDVIVSWVPLYHDMGFIACLLHPLASGVPAVMLNPLDWVARPSLYLHAVSAGQPLGYRVGRELFVTCRKKELLIVGGGNVWPQDLESVATAVDGLHPGRAVAFAEFGPARQTEKVVVLCETDASPAQQRALVLALRQRILAALQLANFGVHLVPPGWLVKSSSGNLALRENQARWSQRAAPQGVRVARDEGAQGCSAAEV